MWEVNGTVDDNCPNIQKPRYFTWLAWISQKANGWAENLTVTAPSPCPCMVHKVHHKVVPVLRPYLPSAFMSRAAGPVGRWWDEIITTCFALWPKPSKKGCFGLLSTPPHTHAHTHTSHFLASLLFLIWQARDWTEKSWGLWKDDVWGLWPLSGFRIIHLGMF